MIEFYKAKVSQIYKKGGYTYVLGEKLWKLKCKVK